jgi:hypothetical protein
MTKPENVSFTIGHIQSLKYEIDYFKKVASISDEDIKEEMK